MAFFSQSIIKYITEDFNFTQLHYQLLKTKTNKTWKINVDTSIFRECSCPPILTGV